MSGRDRKRLPRGWSWALPGALAAIAACVPLLAPTTASAAAARVDDGRLVFTAGDDERNAVQLSGSVRGRGFRFTIVDPGATVLVAGRGCTPTSVRSLRCDANEFHLLTGDEDDSVVFPGVSGRAPRGRIDTGPGDDAVGTAAPRMAIAGGPDDDVLLSRPPASDVNGGTLRGGSGNDRLSGRPQAGPTGPGTNPQQLFGGSGDDVLRGGEEQFGSTGDDDLDGQAGRDRLRGESGNDSLTGSSGRDRFSGGRGADVIDSAAGDAGGFPERIFCGTGRDRVSPNAVDRLARSCNLVEESEERMTAVPRSRGATLRFRLRCRRTRACRGTLRLRRPGRLLSFARKRYRVGADDAATISVPLSRSARRALARRGGVRTRVSTATLAYTIVLKR